jgi:hypothetical protein
VVCHGEGGGVVKVRSGAYGVFGVEVRVRFCLRENCAARGVVFGARCARRRVRTGGGVGMKWNVPEGGCFTGFPEENKSSVVGGGISDAAVRGCFTT